MLSARMRSLVLALVGLGIAAGLLSYSLRRAGIDQLLAALAALPLLTLLPALLLEALVQCGKALKWQGILSRVANVRFSSALAGVVVGAATTHLLPLRLDELVRAAVLSKREDIPPAKVLGTVAVDRLVEMAVVGVLLVLLTISGTLPDWMAQGAQLLALGFGLAVATAFGLVWGRDRVEAVLSKRTGPLATRLSQTVAGLVEGLASFPRGRGLALLGLGTALEWGATLAFYAWLMRVFEISGKAWVAAILALGNTVAYAVPNVPGALGTFEAVQAAVLEQLAGLPAAEALACALAAHAVVAIPVTLAGSLWALVMGLRIPRREGRISPAAPSREGPGPHEETGADSAQKLSPSNDTTRFLGPALGGLAALALWTVLTPGAAPTGPQAVSASVAEARAEGIVSFTIRSGYDKGQERRAWLLGCVLIPLGFWGGGWAQRRRRTGRRTADRGPSQGQDPPQIETPSEEGEMASAPVYTGSSVLARAPTWLEPAVIALACFGLLGQLGTFLGHPAWGSFGLLGEEGVYLGALQALETGRVLYRDLHFPYGPWLLWPLVGWTALFGKTVVSVRLFVLLLHLLGICCVAGTLRLALGRGREARAAAAVGALLAALLAPTFLPTLNAALLRPALAFLPGALALAGLRRSRRMRRASADRGRGAAKVWLAEGWPLALAGLGVAAAALISIEVGAASLAGLGAALVSGRGERNHWAAAAGGGCLGLVALSSPLLLTGALGAFLDQQQATLHLGAQGYQALPYPDAFSLFRDGDGMQGSYPPGDAATFLWSLLPPLAIWLGLGAAACREPSGRGQGRNAALATLSLCGAALFLGSLGRSDLYHLWFYGAVPLVLLSSLALLSLWDSTRGTLRALALGLACAAAFFLSEVGAAEEVGFPDAEEEHLASLAGIEEPLVESVLDIPRAGGLSLRPRLRKQVAATVARVAALPADDGVYFYPSEAAYYFLCDRPLPSRFLWAYDAATPAMQEDAVDELETSRPRWVVRASDTFPIDWIPQVELAPGLERYLAQNYREVGLLPGARLLERRSK